MDDERLRLRSRVAELERQLDLQRRESRYYQRLAKAAGDERLREGESYSRLVAQLKEKIWLAETQHAALEKLHAEIERVSMLDDLTQLLNRRGATAGFQRVFAECQRRPRGKAADTRCYCALIEIDALKDVNERFGYSAGDELLRRFGTLLRKAEQLREEDIVGRFGGKVFILGLLDRDEQNVMTDLRALQAQIHRYRFRVVLDTKINITANVGMSALAPQDISVFDVIDRADEALRQVRAEGSGTIRNRPV